MTIAAGETAVSDQTVPAIANPKLWHPDHPALYKALTTVSVDGKAVDTYETTFGIRSIKWTADQGMFLNGEHYYLRGANAHQDHAGWGDAVCNSGFTRDVQMLKDAGFNWIRGSHYPHAPAYLKACDEKGMLYWSENIFWGTGGKQTDGVWSASGYPVTKKDENGFEESVLRELGEMIRIHRNSPSVMAWSTSNEPFFSDSKVMDKVAALLKKEVEVIHQLDPTRSAAIGGCQRPTGAKRIDKLGDIAGYNGDGARIPDFQNPGIPSVVSEYGSVTAIRPGKYIPCWGSDFAKLKDGCPEEPAWRSGQAIWCAFDHGSIAGSSLGKMGIIDYFRVPKRAYYWYRNQYAKVAPPTWPEAGTPAQLGLKATSTELASTDGTEDARLDISIQDASGKLISNAVSVTLTIESGPGELPTGKTISFEPDPKADIPIIDGQAAIEFRSYYAGTTVIRATSAGLKDATIQIVSKGGPAYVKGKTPETQDRPYVHFTGAPVNASSGASTSLSLNRPTKASSMAQGAASSVANDGNAGTVWKAADNAADAWWQTFLENSYQVNRVQLVFPAEGNYRFQIQTSADGQTWKPVLDQSQTTDTDKTRTFFGNFGNAVGYVRVQFVGLPDGQPAALAEVTVGGGKDMTLDAAQLSGRIIGTPGSWKNDSACAMDAAMDGNQETFFDAAQESGAWVGLDLGTPQGVAKVRYCPRKELPQRMVGGKFQGANKADFSDAVDLFTVSVAPADGKMTEQKIENPAAFRYVRYVSPDNGSCNIAEMEFCGLGK
ncbi:TPA: beta-galactosidase [Candidatus Sumerlaeota bacterium]|nr:beta-galactosidase [Candidatus Sumerlaeota bacterium]